MKRNLPYLLIGKFSSLFGSGLFAFVAGLIVLKETGSGLQFSLVLLAGMLPRVLFSPVAGAFADRFDRKKIIVSMEIASSVLLFLTMMLSTLFTFHYYHFMIVSGLLTLFSTFLSVTLTSSIPSLFEQDDLQKANSLMQSVGSVSGISSPLVAGFLYALMPFHFFVILPATLFLLAAFLDSRLLFLERAVEKKEDTSMVSEIKEGFQYLLNQRTLWTLTQLALVLNFFFIALEVLFPIIALERLDLSSVQFGFIESIFAVGVLMALILFSTPLVNDNRPRATTRMSTSQSATPFTVAALPLTVPFPSDLWIVVFYVTLFLTFGFIILRVNIPIQIYMQTETDPRYLGRVMGVIESMALGIAPLGTVLFGFLSDYVPLQWLFLFSSVSMLVAITFAMGRLKTVVRSEMAKAG